MWLCILVSREFENEYKEWEWTVSYLVNDLLKAGLLFFSVSEKTYIEDKFWYISSWLNIVSITKHPFCACAVRDIWYICIGLCNFFRSVIISCLLLAYLPNYKPLFTTPVFSQYLHLRRVRLEGYLWTLIWSDVLVNHPLIYHYRVFHNISRTS